jgi:hypothetical protein
MSARLSEPAFAGSMAMSCLFVGMMTKKVTGQFAIMRSAPTAHPAWRVCHHAASPRRKPITAKGACMTVPRL